jgi:hypothetical protein
MKYAVVSWIDGWATASRATMLVDASSAADARKQVKAKRATEYGAHGKASNVKIDQVSRYKF